MRFLMTLALLCAAAVAQSAPSKSFSPFEVLNFLVGEWTAEGSGDPGKGTGGFSLKPDLGGHLLVRKSFAEYPTTKDRPAFRHDDVMNIFEEDGKLRAIYFDSEGHVIRYGISTEKDSAVFLSEGDGPHYRLTYRVLDPRMLSIKFEIASPGSSEFKTYIEATASRK